VLVKVPSCPNRDFFCVVDRFVNDGEEFVVVGREDMGWDRVNCQLYSSWCRGKRKPGVIPNWEGLVEVAGESLEVWGVGKSGGIGVGTGEGESSLFVNLHDDTFGKKAVGVGEGGGGNSWKEGSYTLGKSMRDKFDSDSKEAS